MRGGGCGQGKGTAQRREGKRPEPGAARAGWEGRGPTGRLAGQEGGPRSIQESCVGRRQGEEEGPELEIGLFLKHFPARGVFQV